MSIENSDPRKQPGTGEDLGVDEKGNLRKRFINPDNGTVSIESDEEHRERIGDENADNNK